MKRKLFILGTLGLAGLFAGGVVAAYTITDLADKQGIKITPGTITDDEVGNVTLEWGEMASFTKVEGLDANTPVTRTVNVKATKRDEAGEIEAAAVYLGKLDVELKDLSGKAASAERLIDYLHVDINGYTYSNNQWASQKSKLGEIPTEGEGAFSTSLSVYADKDGKAVDFVISLDAKAVPVMSQIMSDQVYLTVDWNRTEGDAESGMKHVFIPSNGWNSMYVYAYSANGGQNADWPGVQLTKNNTNGLFEGDISEHDFYIFNDGGDNQYPAANEDGMAKADINYGTAAAMYFDWTSHTFTTTEPTVAADYYLVSEPSWATQAAYGFVNADAENEDTRVEHQYKLVAAVETGVEYKFCGKAWLGYAEIEVGEPEGYSPRSLVEEGESDGNFTFKAAGTYTFYLKEWKDGGHSVYILNPNA